MPGKINGRPTIFTKELLDKLEYVFALGGTDKEACLFADVSPAALYIYQQKNPGFVERKELLKESPILVARESVVKNLKRNPELALKFLERKKKDEFALRSELTGAGGGPIETMNRPLPELIEEARRLGLDTTAYESHLRPSEDGADPQN